MNSFKNSNSRKVYSSYLKKLKFNKLRVYRYLTDISDNYILKTAPSRHTDHASEKTYKGTLPNDPNSHTPLTLPCPQCFRSVVNIDKYLSFYPAKRLTTALKN